MKKAKSLLGALFMAAIVFGMMSAASATPVNITVNTAYIASGEQTNVADIEDIIYPIMGDVDEWYRSTPPSTEAYPLAGSYQVTWLPDAAAKENAEISYTGGDYIGPIAYLLAKNGLAPPTNDPYYAWRLYDLTSLGWTGTEHITITGLWPGNGSFSHISMYSATVVAKVPEPMTLILYGFGFAGAGLYRHLRRKPK